MKLKLYGLLAVSSRLNRRGGGICNVSKKIWTHTISKTGDKDKNRYNQYIIQVYAYSGLQYKLLEDRLAIRLSVL